MQMKGVTGLPRRLLDAALFECCEAVSVQSRERLGRNIDGIMNVFTRTSGEFLFEAAWHKRAKQHEHVLRMHAATILLEKHRSALQVLLAVSDPFTPLVRLELCQPSRPHALCCCGRGQITVSDGLRSHSAGHILRAIQAEAGTLLPTLKSTRSRSRPTRIPDCHRRPRGHGW